MKILNQDRILYELKKMIFGMDDDYHKMGLDCVRKVSELIESNEWRVEKVTAKGDTIHSMQREKLGKIYKLTARLKYPAKLLLDELYYKIEDQPKWNPTVLESKIIRKINSYTDITYQTSASVGGGLVKSRDFVNLRCWRLVLNGEIMDLENIEKLNQSDDENLLSPSCEGSVSTISDSGDSATPHVGSVGSARESGGYDGAIGSQNHFFKLSKSLGARGFGDSTTIQPRPPPFEFEEPPPLEDFQDANESVEGSEKPPNASSSIGRTKNHIWISAAISIPYAALPPTPKCTRGENLITGFVFREVVGKPDVCIMEWILCLDLKGYIPRYVLESVYNTFMSDYMSHLRKYIKELRQRRHKSLKH